MITSFDMKPCRLRIIYNTTNQQKNLKLKNMYVVIGNTKLKKPKLNELTCY